MNQPATINPWPILGPDDPPLDLSRENAAYERERENLVREHLGKIALIYEDAVIGVFPNADEALKEGFRRFGFARMMLKLIGESDSPEYISQVNVNHPSFKKVTD
jgi:hypothetical protein